MLQAKVKSQSFLSAEILPILIPAQVTKGRAILVIICTLSAACSVLFFYKELCIIIDGRWVIPLPKYSIRWRDPFFFSKNFSFNFPIFFFFISLNEPFTAIFVFNQIVYFCYCNCPSIYEKLTVPAQHFMACNIIILFIIIIFFLNKK